jgi:hypothetical protein
VIVTVLFLLLIEVQSADFSMNPTGTTVLPHDDNGSEPVTAPSIIRAPIRNPYRCPLGQRLQNGKCRVVW